MIFNYPERAGVLPYRDTESQFRRDDLTSASPSGRPTERRRLAAYPAVHSASAAMITVSALVTSSGSTTMASATEPNTSGLPGATASQNRRVRTAAGGQRRPVG